MYAFFGVSVSPLFRDLISETHLPSFVKIGAFASPLIIGSFVDKGISWSKYYFAPLGLSLVLAIFGFFAFKGCKLINSASGSSPYKTRADDIPHVQTSSPWMRNTKFPRV